LFFTIKHKMTSLEIEYVEPQQDETDDMANVVSDTLLNMLEDENVNSPRLEAQPASSLYGITLLLPLKDVLSNSGLYTEDKLNKLLSDLYDALRKNPENTKKILKALAARFSKKYKKEKDLVKNVKKALNAINKKIDAQRKRLEKSGALRPDVVRVKDIPRRSRPRFAALRSPTLTRKLRAVNVRAREPAFRRSTFADQMTGIDSQAINPYIQRSAASVASPPPSPVASSDSDEEDDIAATWSPRRLAERDDLLERTFRRRQQQRRWSDETTGFLPQAMWEQEVERGSASEMPALELPPPRPVPGTRTASGLQYVVPPLEDEEEKRRKLFDRLGQQSMTLFKMTGSSRRPVSRYASTTELQREVSKRQDAINRARMKKAVSYLEKNNARDLIEEARRGAGNFLESLEKAVQGLKWDKDQAGMKRLRDQGLGAFRGDRLADAMEIQRKMADVAAKARANKKRKLAEREKASSRAREQATLYVKNYYEASRNDQVERGLPRIPKLFRKIGEFRDGSTGEEFVSMSNTITGRVSKIPLSEFQKNWLTFSEYQIWLDEAIRAADDQDMDLVDFLQKKSKASAKSPPREAVAASSFEVGDVVKKTKGAGKGQMVRITQLAGNKLGGVFVEGGKTVRLQSVKNFK
jgi:hypothetical protein